MTANSLDWINPLRDSRIWVKISTHGNACEIVFSDNGPGISPEIASNVFEPHFSGKEGGCGMGLTIARNVVSLARGTIEVISDRRRRGARIQILLPLKRSRSTTGVVA